MYKRGREYTSSGDNTSSLPISRKNNITTTLKMLSRDPS